MTYPSAFAGRLRELPGVSVDNFTGDNLRSRAFFLSHCHTDHMQGLHSGELRAVLQADPVRIYMSELSAAIVRKDASAVLSEAIMVLDLETVHVQLPPKENWREEHLTVTVIPAGHCLGSVMFLFRTSRDQTALYTGDFRISQSDVGKFAQLHKNGEPISIDALYIDTTFIDPKYSDFPKRSDCMDELERRIVDWLKVDEENQVALSTSAYYGYEFVFMELSKRLKMKIFVDANKWKFYSQLKSVEPAVTSDETSTRVHACRHVAEGYDHRRCGLSTARPAKLLFIRMSAQRFQSYELYASPILVTSRSRLDVCFPTHCSSREIRAFVAYYEPARVVGFPRDYVESCEGDRGGEVDIGEVQVTPPKMLKRKRSSPFAKSPDVKVDRSVLKKLFEDI